MIKPTLMLRIKHLLMPKSMILYTGTLTKEDFTALTGKKGLVELICSLLDFIEDYCEPV